MKQTKELKNEESKYNLKGNTKKLENIGKQNSPLPIGSKSEDENVKPLSVTELVEIDEWHLHYCLEGLRNKSPSSINSNIFFYLLYNGLKG